MNWDKVYKEGKGITLCMAEKMVKLSVSVGSDVVEWIDREIEKRVYRNRSHALDVAAHRLMEQEHD